MSRITRLICDDVLESPLIVINVFDTLSALPELPQRILYSTNG